MPGVFYKMLFFKTSLAEASSPGALTRVGDETAAESQIGAILMRSVHNVNSYFHFRTSGCVGDARERALSEWD